MILQLSDKQLKALILGICKKLDGQSLTVRHFQKALLHTFIVKISTWKLINL